MTELLFAALAGSLFAIGIYLLMRRSILKLVIGLLLLGHAANLSIFTAGRLGSPVPPIMTKDAVQLTTPTADPMPQALILTAIVIGFGLQAFLIVLVWRIVARNGVEDTDEMTSTDIIDGGQGDGK